MLAKELLSGLWVRPECRSYCRHSHIWSCLTSCLPFISFSPLSLRHGVVVVCFEVIKGESSCHSAYAMWSRGSWLGKSLVSAWCCVASLTCVYGLVCVCFPLFLCLFSCCFGHTRMWWHKAAITCMNPPMNWVPVILVCWVWLVLFLLFGFVFVSFVCVSLLFAWFMMMTAQWTTREALLSEAGFEKVFRTQNWVRRSKLFCRWFCFLLGQVGCISVAAWTHLSLASYYFVASGGLIVCR